MKARSDEPGDRPHEVLRGENRADQYDDVLIMLEYYPANKGVTTDRDSIGLAESHPLSC